MYNIVLYIYTYTCVTIRIFAVSQQQDAIAMDAWAFSGDQMGVPRHVPKQWSAMAIPCMVGHKRL